MYARLYINYYNGKLDSVYVDISETRFGKEIWTVKTDLLKTRKRAEEFLLEQVQQYKWEHDVEFQPEFHILESKVISSDKPLILE